MHFHNILQYYLIGTRRVLLKLHRIGKILFFSKMHLDFACVQLYISIIEAPLVGTKLYLDNLISNQHWVNILSRTLIFHVYICTTPSCCWLETESPTFPLNLLASCLHRSDSFSSSTLLIIVYRIFRCVGLTYDVSSSIYEQPVMLSSTDWNVL